MPYKNPADKAAQTLRWRHKNRDKVAEYNKRYQGERPEEMKERGRRQRENNPVAYEMKLDRARARRQEQADFVRNRADNSSKPWSRSEDRYIEDTMGDPLVFVALELGRTLSATAHRRSTRKARLAVERDVYRSSALRSSRV